MKKFIFSAIAAIGLLLSPSCSDENEALSGSGNEALVSFSVNLADGIQTKATIGDGTKAKNLVVDVFEKNTTNDEYTQVGGLRQKHDGAFNDGLTTTVNFNLVKGKTYRLIFWAQKQSVVSSNANSPYNIDDLSKIKVNYHAGITVDEDRDAFLYVTDPITVSGNFSEEVTMTRPFAQLNYLIDKAEYDAAVAAGMVIQKAKVTVAKVATELYPLKNSVGVPAENVMFEVTDFPTNFTESPLKNYITLPKPGVAQESTPTTEKYYYLASKYFLVYAGDGAADKAGVSATLATTSLKLQDASGDIANYEFKVPAVPVQRNYRTNIYGNLITSEGEFTVNIVPGFSGEDNNLPQSAAVVNNYGEIAGKIAEGATTIIASESFTLSNNSTEPTTITVPKNYASGNNGVELTFDLSKATVTGGGTAEITITEGTGAQSLPENVNVIASGNVTINLPTSHVTLNGAEVDGSGTYHEVIASTSGTTLVVPNGVTVTTLKVKKGNVRIEKGGKVGTIENETDPKTDVIVYLEDGGILETMPDASTRIIVVQPSIISNAAELKAFAESVNRGYTYAGETVVLNADIDLSGVEWTPIGGLVSYPSVTFAGTFDGNNHTISNLTTTDFTVNHATAGFFGSITGTIKNLTLTNVNITSSHYAGGIVGYSSNKGTSTITNCHVNGGTITSTPEYTGTTDDSTNGYDNGDKVGGIIGYMVAGDKVENCSVSNVTIKAYRDLGGIAGYAAGTVTNNKVSDVTLIQDNTNGYKADPITTYAEVIGREASATATDNTFSNVTKTVKTFGALDFYKAAIGGDATLTEDATLSAVYEGYGKTAVNQNGGTIDGLNNTLTVKGANNTWDCSIYTKGGTIKNLTIKGGFRGIFTGGLTEDLNVENVVLDYCCYTFNADASNGKSVYFKDCTLNGWTSYTSGFANFSFTNCSFGKGSGGYNYAYLRPYSPTTLENCRFSVDYEMDASQTSGIVLKNCYVGETLITQGNLTELLGEDAANATVENAD